MKSYRGTFLKGETVVLFLDSWLHSRGPAQGQAQGQSGNRLKRRLVLGGCSLSSQLQGRGLFNTDETHQTTKNIGAARKRLTPAEVAT